jgi:hypothetical protein
VATVVFQPDFARRYTEGATSIEIDAPDYQALIEALDERYPGFLEGVAARVAIAIDGEIFHDPLLQVIGPTSEVFFLPLLEAG